MCVPTWHPQMLTCGINDHGWSGLQAGQIVIALLPGSRDSVTRVEAKSRRGAATVEFAVVVPFLLMIILGFIEFGRAMMASELIANATREGARKGALPGSSTADIRSTVTTALNKAGIATENASITVLVQGQARDANTAQTGESIEVKVIVPYRDVSWLPTSLFLEKTNLAGKVVMRRE